MGPLRRTIVPPLLLLVVVAVSWVLTGVTQVQPGERAVVRRFGRVLDHKPGPGLYVGLPWGIDRVDRVKVEEVRRVKVGHSPQEADDTGQTTPPGQLLTGDHNLINVQVVLEYAVEEEEVENFVLQADRADELVARAAEAVLAEWVAGREVDVVLLRGKAILPPWLVQHTQQRLEPYKLGVRVKEANVTHLYPPAEVKDAFDEVARAQTEIRTQIYKAEEQANSKLREADAEEFRIGRQTAAYREEQRLAALAEAGNFQKRLRQYQLLGKDSPDYLNAIWWDEMGRLFVRMRENGRIDLLDHHLGKDGLDITQIPALPKKK